MSAPFTIADTLYYGASATGVIATLATDQSHYADNQTTGASWHYEPSPASRFDLTTQWTVEVRVRADNTATGRLYNYANVGLRMTAGGIVEPILNAAVQLGITLPGIGASGEEFLISWSVRPNPDTTGAGDALITELRAWNLTTPQAPAVNRYTHAIRTAGTADQIWWASTTLGANAYTHTPFACRFSSAYHTAEESYEEMGTASAVPTLVGESRSEIQVPPRSLGIGNDGHFAGPVHALSAAASATNDMRLAGPLGHVLRNRITHRGDRVGDEAEVYEDPDVAGSYLYTHWLRWVDVPPGANRLRVRVFIQQWRTTGDADTVHTTALCMSQPGWVHKPATSPASIQVYRDTVSRLNDDTSGATSGAWITFDPLRIARDNDGATYVGLAFRVTSPGGAGSTADQLWTVKAIEIDPIFVDTDDQQPGLGG
jgi:hypothetical protein